MSWKPLEPTEEMIEAGMQQAVEQCPEIDHLDQSEMSDLVCFIWQAMYSAHKELA
ncbi:hypothetical protein IHE77_13930 [Serratia ureilytica]|uniref:hypothetical protein n=1 Tax=Serratia TaxID=613 RepID=UPI000B22E264|nr:MULTISPECIES: hypothetical protein [Serratia]UNE41983.1 hypothetical protein IHE77_13930 [Serratia ureilytica]